MKNKKSLSVTTVKTEFEMVDTYGYPISEKQIADKIQSAIENSDIGELEFVDEEDDGMTLNDTYFLNGDVKVEVEKLTVTVCEKPFCEHCGDGYTDYGIEISNGGTSYCFNCRGDELSDSFKEDVLEMEKKGRKKFLMEKKAEIEAELNNMDNA